ncbi:MAG: hypothetical protein B7Z37_16160 [Verrucomicrobia bacterium 12-59-8]|nr:MAG: hypothetical protein B7Z37_16160 [Verrucomicrobia bacterium 12-59-8]
MLLGCEFFPFRCVGQPVVFTIQRLLISIRGALVLSFLQARRARLERVVLVGLMPNESLDIQREPELGAMHYLSRDGESLLLFVKEAIATAKGWFVTAGGRRMQNSLFPNPEFVPVLSDHFRATKKRTIKGGILCGWPRHILLPIGR